MDIFLVHSVVSNGKLQLVDIDLNTFRKRIDSGIIGVIKSVLPEKKTLQFRKALLKWAEEEPGDNPAIEDPHLYKSNFHRKDINPPLAKVKRIFYEFNLNNIFQAPNYLRGIANEIFTVMLNFQNLLSGTDATFFDGSKENVEKSSLMVHPQVIQYPSGGGFFQEHKHSYLPQRFGLILNLSKRGKDFHSGGTRFWRKDGKLIEVEEHQKVGDLTVFRYDLLHDVSTVDEKSELKLMDESGRWIAILPYYSQNMIY